MRPNGNWPRKGPSCRNNTISNVVPLGPVLTLSLTHWVGMSTLGPSSTSMKHWNGLTISGAPALWITVSCPDGLLMGLGWSLLADLPEHLHVSTCSHILKAYNHKVNHDTHKELPMQELTVMQYTQALQYMRFCNNKRYKDRLGQTELTGGDDHSHSCTPSTRGQELEGPESEHREHEGRSHSKSMT